MLQNAWYKLGRYLVSLLARGGLELSIDWKAPIPPGAVILAANHPSTFDPGFLTTLTPNKISVLIRESLFKIPVFGSSLRACGHIPVVYGNGQQALDEAEKLLKEGRTIAIFPEGRISPLEGGFNKPHSGLARLALKTGAPVVPVGIYLDHKQIYRVETKERTDDDIEIGALYFHGPYAITVGNTLRFTGDANDRQLVTQVSEQIMRRIILLSGESAKRVRTKQRLNWLRATRWWLWSPVRLIRYWYAFEGIKID
ncbi:MAG: lysophospholipid acyltransferase family protein [Anaerolineaceae bacterium]|nr:lysophospholipid acyltransferase family protein [Anaerolineaceae bacterium]